MWTFVSLSVCLCVSVCICLCLWIYICVCVCVCLFSKQMPACVCLCVCIWVFVLGHLAVRLCVWACVYVYVCFVMWDFIGMFGFWRDGPLLFPASEWHLAEWETESLLPSLFMSSASLFFTLRHIGCLWSLWYFTSRAWFYNILLDFSGSSLIFLVRDPESFDTVDTSQPASASFSLLSPFPSSARSGGTSYTTEALDRCFPTPDTEALEDFWLVTILYALRAISWLEMEQDSESRGSKAGQGFSVEAHTLCWATLHFPRCLTDSLSSESYVTPVSGICPNLIFLFLGFPFQLCSFYQRTTWFFSVTCLFSISLIFALKSF